MDNAISIYTVGFTKKTAEEFFELLRAHQITVVVDTRLRPNTQLSGFARGVDLPYLLNRLIDADYRQMPLMSPTDELLDAYRTAKNGWALYEDKFLALLEARDLISTLDKAWWASNRVCLLCSEHEPDHCHRRLVAEYIASAWSEVIIRHLL